MNISDHLKLSAVIEKLDCEITEFETPLKDRELFILNNGLVAVADDCSLVFACKTFDVVFLDIHSDITERDSIFCKNQLRALIKH